MNLFKYFLVLLIVALLCSCKIEGRWISDHHSSGHKECFYAVHFKKGTIKEKKKFIFKEVYFKGGTFKTEEGKIFKEKIPADSVHSVEGVWGRSKDKITLCAQGKMPAEFYIRQLSMNKMTLVKDGEILIFQRQYYNDNAVGKFIEYIYGYGTDYIAVLLINGGYL